MSHLKDFIHLLSILSFCKSWIPFWGVLASPPVRLSREGGTQRRCVGTGPATLLLLLFALLFNCGCVFCGLFPPEFEVGKMEAKKR